MDQALRAAQARIADSQHTCLEKLPNEVKCFIVGHCDPKTVINLALTCPMMYHSIKENEAYIAYNMAVPVIGMDLLLLAMARLHAYKSRDKHGSDIYTMTEISQSIIAFTERFFGRAASEPTCLSGLRLTLNDANELLSFHSVARYYALKIARIALQNSLDAAEWTFFTTYPRYAIRVSDKEYQRFVKALYIWQLACDIFPGKTPFRWTSNPQHKLYWAHEKFWAAFPPWVCQQVRCTHTLLCEYINAVIDPKWQMQRSTFSLAYIPPDSMLGRFVAQKGLITMREYEDHESTNIHLDEFYRGWEYPFGNRKTALFESHDQSWLNRNMSDDMISLDISHVLSKYAEEGEDSGPIDGWLHALLRSFIKHPILRPGRKGMFRCERCMTEWGFVFWDREKLEYNTRNTMPTTEEMMRISSRAKVHITQFLRISEGRDNRACTCSRS
ncbi:hypothetical protein F5Y04DRAFT_281808 [Hypomontagnella monticulosa]|nr:hypothetical protein F5Y04DRAFT_281808 [Hypomontagnella monticulosa]